MAKMLDGPVPDGARSVSWPWYHHVLTNELTPDARRLLATYSGISPKYMEEHIYRIVSALSRYQTNPADHVASSETKPGGSSPGPVLANSGS